MRLARRMAAGAMVLGLGAAGGCGDDDGAALATTTTITTAAPTTSPTAAPPEPTTTRVGPTTTAAPTTAAAPTTTTAPPVLTPEQTDWIPIVEELYARKNALAAAPDRTAEVAVEGQPYFETILQSATDIAQRGLHPEVDPLRVARVELLHVTATFPDGSPGAVTLQIWKHPQSGKGLVDADGNVVIPLGQSSFPIGEGELARNNISIRRFTKEEPWRFEDEYEIAPAAP